MNGLVKNIVLDKDKEGILQKFKELFKNVALDSPNPDQVEELKQFIQENQSIFRETYNLSNMVVDNLLSLPETNQTYTTNQRRVIFQLEPHSVGL